jgi:hypothetical protein
MGYHASSARRRLAGKSCNACAVLIDALPWYESERFCDRCSASKFIKKVRMAFVFTSRWEVMFFEDDPQQTMLPRRALIQSDEGLIAFSKRAGGPRTPEHRAGLERMVKRGFGEVFVNLSAEQYWKLKHLGTPCRQ